MMVFFYSCYLEWSVKVGHEHQVRLNCFLIVDWLNVCTHLTYYSPFNELYALLFFNSILHNFPPSTSTYFLYSLWDHVMFNLNISINVAIALLLSWLPLVLFSFALGIEYTCFHISFFLLLFVVAVNINQVLYIDFATSEMYVCYFYLAIIECATTKNHIKLVPRS